MDPRRTQRVAETIRKELAELVQFEISDPRAAGVVVTEVAPSPDLKTALVRVAVSGSQQQQRDALDALDHARHFLRRQLSQRITTWRSPELRFEIDKGPGATSRVDELLKRAQKWRAKIRDSSAPGAIE
jgi:ribosome-binding factor A